MSFGRVARAQASPSPSAAASSKGSRIARMTTDARGITITMDLEHAPFPAPGSWYRDATVHAFIPRYYRAADDGSVGAIVHFHGHNSTAERAMVVHQLREQLYESKQNTVLIVPELATLASDSSCGKLEAPGGFGRMLNDALRTLDAPEVRARASRSALPRGARPGRICLSAHSGGYHAAACSLRSDGANIQEVYLFDALYADVDILKAWVIEGHGKPMGARHKLVSYYTEGTTEHNTRALFADLEKAGVVCANELIEGTLSREELTLAEAVSIKTQLSHGAVTRENNGLRDCLYASSQRRRLRSSWFDSKKGARPLERRR
jgi:hypothetical protein